MKIHTLENRWEIFGEFFYIRNQRPKIIINHFLKANELNFKKSSLATAVECRRWLKRISHSGWKTCGWAMVSRFSRENLEKSEKFRRLNCSSQDVKEFFIVNHMAKKKSTVGMYAGALCFRRGTVCFIIASFVWKYLYVLRVKCWVKVYPVQVTLKNLPNSWIKKTKIRLKKFDVSAFYRFAFQC